jgi:hypothetical protein
MKAGGKQQVVFQNKLICTLLMQVATSKRKQLKYICYVTMYIECTIPM